MKSINKVSRTSRGSYVEARYEPAQPSKGKTWPAEQQGNGAAARRLRQAAAIAARKQAAE